MTRATVICGPTASGKSALALALAEATGGVVINADSMQVYAELAIVTARPGAADLARAPHRLYGVLPARDRCSAGRWREMALSEIAAAGEAHAILVGGTGLYLSALLDGFVRTPPIPDAVAAAIAARMDAEGAPALHAELGRRDPDSAATLAPADGHRIARALAVLDATGRALSDWRRDAPSPPWGEPHRVVKVAPPRAALRGAIRARAEAMLRAGAPEEAAQFFCAVDPAGATPAAKAVGLRAFADCAAGRLGQTETVERVTTATAQYAKRQRTWFAKRPAAELVIDAQLSASLIPEIVAKIRMMR